MLFNIFLYSGIALVSIAAVPFLFLKEKYMLFLGRFLSHYVVFILKIFLNTKTEFKGLDNLFISIVHPGIIFPRDSSSTKHTLNDSPHLFIIDFKVKYKYKH